VFYINIPVGAISLLMIKLFIFDPPYIQRRSGRIDYWGIGLLAVGIGALQILLDKGQQEDWFASTAMCVTAAVAFAGLLAFVLRELRVEHPVVDLRVLRERTYSTGVFLMTVLGFVLYGSLVLLPIMLQTLLGYPSLQAGIAMAPRGMGSFIAMPIVGMLVAKMDPRKLLAGGICGGALTLYWLGNLSLSAGYWDVFWPQFIQGMSLGLIFVPLTTISMDPIPKETMGNATSLFNLMRNIGGSVGIALSTTMLSRRAQANIASLGSHVTIYDAKSMAMLEGLRSSLVAHGMDVATATKQAQAMVLGLVARQATMLAFVGVFRLLAIIFILMLPLLLLMRPPRHRRAGAALH
jgi:DHA2 family multidrug resistance protein